MRVRGSTTAVAAAFVLAAALGVAATRSGDGSRAAPAIRDRDSPVASRSARVGGTGTVLWLGGDERPRFCSGYGWVKETDQPKVPAPMPGCNDMFVWVEGVDRDRLTGLTTKDFGYTVRTWGTAYLEGEMRGDTLHVDHHGPPRPPDKELERRSVEQARTVPCPAPRGGWPVGEPLPNMPDANERSFEPRGVSYSAMTQYEHDEPEQVVSLATRWYTRKQPVLVLVVVRPERVPAQVRKEALGALCVLKSRYTRAQVDAAEKDAERWSLSNRARAVLGDGLDAQAQIELYVPVLTPEVEAFVTSHPDRLVAPYAWLDPVE